MYIYIENKAPNTIRFLRYLVFELLRREPLKKGKTVIIPINEHSEHFPEFNESLYEENPEQPPEEFVKIWTDKGYSIQKSREQTTEDFVTARANMAMAKVKLLGYYLKDKFGNHTIIKKPMLETKNPFACTLSFVINNPVGIYKMAEKLDIETPIFSGLANEKLPLPSQLKRDPLRICIGATEIPIAEGTIQGRLVEVMFEYKPGAMIELADLVDKTFSEAIVYPSEKWKSVNNAIFG